MLAIIAPKAQLGPARILPPINHVFTTIYIA